MSFLLTMVFFFMSLPDVSCSLSFHVVVHHERLHAAVEVNRTEAAASGEMMYGSYIFMEWIREKRFLKQISRERSC